MNCIFVNVTDKEVLELRGLKLFKGIAYSELLVPLNLLNKRVFENGTGAFGKIKSHFFDKKIISKIKSSIKENLNDEVRFYVLPQVLEKADKKSALFSIKRYMQSLFKTMDIEGYNYTGCIKENIDKYLAEALSKTKKQKSESRVLLVYNKLENVDLDMLDKLIREYKTVDVLSEDIKNSKFKQEIDKINIEYGSSICVKNKVTKQEQKTKPYDICVYMEKSNFKLDNTYKIYIWDSDSDKFDTNVVLANANGILNAVNRDYFSYMTKNYGRLNIISILCKTTLDNK